MKSMIEFIVLEEWIYKSLEGVFLVENNALIYFFFVVVVVVVVAVVVVVVVAVAVAVSSDKLISSWNEILNRFYWIKKKTSSEKQYCIWVKDYKFISFIPNYHNLYFDCKEKPPRKLF